MNVFPGAQVATAESPPDWMIGKDGRLKPFMPMLDTSKGQVHLLCPSGIGDVAWIWAKLWKAHEDLKLAGRELIFHFPETGSNRVAPYAQLVGMNVGCYINAMPDFRQFHKDEDGSRIEHACEPIPEDFDGGCVMFVDANVHIEGGSPLHRGAPKFDPDTNFGEWCPWLPFKNPAPDREKVLAASTVDWPALGPYIVVHLGPVGWMGQNWFPKIYGRILKRLEEIAPVCLMGYGPTGDLKMIEEVLKHYEPHGPSCIDQTYATALACILNSKAMFGIDDGMTIMSTYYGVDTFRMYPDWLCEMPGTWEDSSTLHPNNRWVLLEDLLDGGFDEWLQGMKT